jgi:aldehyde dehydrogenase (NAD+)
MSDKWVEERLLIDGELVPAEGGATYENVNPATEEVLGIAADASPADFERAIAAARRAFDETAWATDLDLRVRCLRQFGEALTKHMSELGELTIDEVGAPKSLIDGPHLGGPVGFCNHFADLAASYQWSTELGSAENFGSTSRRWYEREPVGVVAAISPWNYPNQINLAKIAPALAAGCSVVLKPAPDTPWTGLALGLLAAEYTDIPAGILNIVTSSVKDRGELLTTDPRVDMISFTGSTPVGRRIMEAAGPTVKKVFLELGGKSVHLMLDDVDDIGAGVAGPCIQVCVHAGQGCATTTRLLVPQSRYDEAVEAAAGLIQMLPYGDPRTDGVLMGPLINAAQRDRVEGYVQRGVADGARIVCGGKRPEQFDKGFYFEPTLLADVTNDMAVAREEIFGPVLVVIPYGSDDEAVAIANDSIFGLSGAIVSADRDRAVAIGRRIRTGTMSINGGMWYGADVPFGGYKQSGVGREMGTLGFEEYTEVKAFAEPAG